LGKLYEKYKQIWDFKEARKGGKEVSNDIFKDRSKKVSILLNAYGLEFI
jgi:hypothetical protein